MLEPDEITLYLKNTLALTHAKLSTLYGTTQVPYDPNDPMFLKARIMTLEEVIRNIIELE